MTNPLRQLADAGQAVWLDYLHRRILADGELARLISDDGVRGLTSNPAIFEQAIGGDAYDGALEMLLRGGDREVTALYEALAIADIQGAADAFRSLYEATDGGDGYVSLEVSPYLAMDTEGTVAEARRLWRAVDRPNLMIKVPGTKAGVPAIRALIGEGINVNVTLLFSVDAYLAVAEAHMAGLEALRSAGGDIARVHGVASFFVSRIDGVIDKAIDARLANAPAGEARELKALRGQVAIANAKIAYQHYLERVRSPRGRALAEAGASPQRLLWASTGTKDPTYSDVLYVEALIGPDTVNTMPPKTLDAFRDHGLVSPVLDSDIAGARRVLSAAEAMGLDLAGVTAALEDDGVAKFAEAFDSLLGAVARKRARILGPKLNRQEIILPPDLEAEAKSLAGATAWSRRLWSGDATLWTGADEARWLGWLAPKVDFAALDALAEQARKYRHVLLLGMGGSSLGPEVLAKCLEPAPGFPRFHMLDTTQPDQIARIEAEIEPGRTLFIVSSKSGATLETDLLRRHFFKGNGADFVAITDPGSSLEALARRDGYAHILLGDPAIGGRYSVLSVFGLAPAAAIGLDVRSVAETARVMARACGPDAPPAANPGVALGLALGAAAKAGRNKVTIVASPGLAPFGAWLEQLLAESSGKRGRGLIPVDAEALGPPSVYGPDRVFVHLKLEGEEESTAALSALARAGHPVIVISLSAADLLVQEFFRWEVATAVACAVIGVNAFDQPDVEASKIKARKLAEAYEAGGAPATEAASLGTKLAADLAELISGVRPGDYVGLLAWLDRAPAHERALQRLRTGLRNRLGCATVVGFGPRFLHSTGQAYKGGPNGGVFLHITADPARDLAIPESRLTFAVVARAQAEGDAAVLAERGRRVLKVELGADVSRGLARLTEALERAIAEPADQIPAYHS